MADSIISMTVPLLRDVGNHCLGVGQKAYEQLRATAGTTYDVACKDGLGWGLATCAVGASFACLTTAVHLVAGAETGNAFEKHLRENPTPPPDTPNTPAMPVANEENLPEEPANFRDNAALFGLAAALHVGGEEGIKRCLVKGALATMVVAALIFAAAFGAQHVHASYGLALLLTSVVIPVVSTAAYLIKRYILK